MNLSKTGIAICGFYGSFNLGDEAMLAGMINLFQGCNKDTKITVFSNNPKDTQSRFQVASLHSRSKKILPTILMHKYFVLGGGDLLRDGMRDSVASKWLIYMQQALMLKRYTMLLGISVGDIWRQETKQLIPDVLNKVNLIAVRDNLSKARLEELGVKKKIHIMSDLALQGLYKENVHSAPRKNNSRLKVGISVRRLGDRGVSVADINYNSLQEEMAKIVDFLIEEHDAEVHILPFRTRENSFHPLDDDYVSSLEMLRNSRQSKSCIVHRCFSSLENLTSTIEGLDLVIGMRLHSLILASGLGVPVIAAEYDPKVEGFMREIGQSSLSIPLSDFTIETLSPILKENISNLPRLTNEIRTNMSIYYGKVEGLKDELKSILA